MPIDGYEVHPAADVFPMLDDAALRELADDIRENGLRDSITRIWVDAGAGNGTLKPQILDGRNRFRACEIANVLPQFVDYEGADPVAFVVSKNLRRRHLSPSQKAMAAADLAQLANGTNQHARREGSSRDEPSFTREEAAELLDVSPASIDRAQVVKKHGVPELADAVRAGAVPVKVAADLARHPEEEQREILRKVESGEARNVRDAMDEPRPKARAPKMEPDTIDDDVPDESERIPGRRSDAVERERKVTAMLDEGLSTAEIAKALGVKPHTVTGIKARLGLSKKRKSLVTSFAARAVETAEDWERAIAYPEIHFEGSTPAERSELIEGLRTLATSTKRLINWLNKEANEVLSDVENGSHGNEDREHPRRGPEGRPGVSAEH
jgi:hypothetical protein